MSHTAAPPVGALHAACNERSRFGQRPQKQASPERDFASLRMLSSEGETHLGRLGGVQVRARRWRYEGNVEKGRHEEPHDTLGRFALGNAQRGPGAVSRIWADLARHGKAVWARKPLEPAAPAWSKSPSLARHAPDSGSAQVVAAALGGTSSSQTPKRGRADAG